MLRSKKEKKSLLEFEVSVGGVRLTQRAIFAKHLSVMLKSGLTITDALMIAADSTQGKFKKILRGVLRSVQSGQPLSSSFKRYPKVFSGLFISAIYAGESSGTLDENLENISIQLEKEKELVSKVKGAMIYPVVVLIAAAILGVVMTFLVLPKITPLFEGLDIDLPITTRALIALSHLVQDHSVALLLGLVGFVIFMIGLARRKFVKPITHLFFLKTPVIKSISRNTNLVHFCRTLGMLLKSGLNIDEALEVTKDTLGNYYYQRALRRVSQHVGRGARLSEVLEQFETLFPLMVTRMVRVGEESGRLEETLLYLANFYEVEVDTSTKSLATVIEPALLIFIGLVVGFLALSIITPIYSITGGVTR